MWGYVDIDMRKDNTLIFLDLRLVHHFIDDTGIGSSTTALYCTRPRSGTAWSFRHVRVTNTGAMSKVVSKWKSHYDRWSVGQFVLVSCPFWSKWPDVTFIWVTVTFVIFHRTPSLMRGRVSNLQCNDTSSISSYIRWSSQKSKSC
jgi:hypothetical protein